MFFIEKQNIIVFMLWIFQNKEQTINKDMILLCFSIQNTMKSCFHYEKNEFFLKCSPLWVTTKSKGDLKGKCKGEGERNV